MSEHNNMSGHLTYTADYATMQLHMLHFLELQISNVHLHQLLSSMPQHRSC